MLILNKLQSYIPLTTIIILLSTELFGGTFYISPDGDDDNGDGSVESPFRSITYTLAEHSGSVDDMLVLRLASGTYSTETGEDFPISLECYLKIIGSENLGSIISGEDNNSSVISSDSVTAFELRSLSITGGNNNNNDNSYGGGLSITNCDNLVLSHCSIYGNEAVIGGGIYVFNCTNIDIRDCTIQSNKSYTKGGGIYFEECENISTYGTNIISNEIESDQACNGVGIYQIGCIDVNIDSCVVSMNTGYGGIDNRGSGYGCYVGYSEYVHISNTLISRNTAAHDYATGIALTVYTCDQVIINNCNVVENTSGEYESGNAVSIQYTDEYLLIDNDIIENGSYSHFSSAVLIRVHSRGLLLNNNIHSNYGTGIQLAGGGEATNRVIIGGKESYGNNIYDNESNYEFGNSLFLLFPRILDPRIIATWNYFGDNVDTTDLSYYLYPDPENAYLVSPIEDNTVNENELSFYSVVLTPELFSNTIGDTIEGKILLCNTSYNEQYTIEVQGVINNSETFLMDQFSDTLNPYSRYYYLFEAIPDTYGVFVDSIKLTYTFGDEEVIQYLTLAMECKSNWIGDHSEFLSTYKSEKTVYPNPNNGRFSISYDAFRREHITIQLVDTNGRVVSKWNKIVNHKGKKQISLSVNQIPSGKYYLMIVDGHTKHLTDMIIIN